MSTVILVDSDKLDDILQNISELRDTVTRYIDKESAVMNITQVSNYLGKTVASIRGLVARSEIPYSKVGGALSFTKSEIDTWISEKKCMPKTKKRKKGKQ